MCQPLSQNSFGGAVGISGGVGAPEEELKIYTAA